MHVISCNEDNILSDFVFSMESDWVMNQRSIFADVGMIARGIPPCSICVDGQTSVAPEVRSSLPERYPCIVPFCAVSPIPARHQSIVESSNPTHVRSEGGEKIICCGIRNRGYIKQLFYLKGF